METKNHNWNENITLDLSQVKECRYFFAGLMFEWKRQAKEI